jgi:hypothetical protein
MKTIQRISSIFVTIFLTSVILLSQVSASGFYGEEPARLSEAQTIVIHALIAVWGLSIFYFIFVVASIGAQWMISMGDEQKLAQLKQRGGNVVIGFAFVFGGYIVVRLVISLLALRSPGDCFSSPFGNNAIFQFFFPDACS